MKKRSLIQAVSLILMLGLLFTTASAAVPTGGSEVQPRFTAITTLTAQLDITSAGRADCWGIVNCRKTSYTATLVFELQRSEDGNDWDTIKTWTNSNTGFAALDESWYVVSGYQYQVYYTAEVFDTDGTLLESVSYTTNVDEY